MTNDIVYILGTGSRWRNNELRYSMRSVEKNLPHAKIIVVGWKPKFLKGAVHIPADDPYQSKLKNSIAKLAIAAMHPEVSEKFVLMNDDFFIMKPMDGVKLYHRGLLEESLAKHPTGEGYYSDAIKLTRDILKIARIGEPKDYSVHGPMLMEKKKVREIVEMIDPTATGYLFRTVYGNWFGLGGEQVDDVKIKDTAGFDPEAWEGMEMVSANDAIALDPKFQSWIRGKFPEPSRYETGEQDFIPNSEAEAAWTTKGRFNWQGRQYEPGDTIRGEIPEHIVEANGLKRVGDDFSSF